MKMAHGVLLYCTCLWPLVGVFSDPDVESVSVMEGDSVTLNSGVAQIQIHDHTEWRFNRIRIARANIPRYDNEERFRDRLKLDHQTGSLTITDTRTTDSGLYKLSTIVGNKEIIKKFNVTVYARPSIPIPPQNPSSESVSVPESFSPSPSPPPVSVSLIVLISSAAAAGSLLTVAAVGIFWICWKDRRTEQQVQTCDEETTHADLTFYKRNTQTAKSEMTEVVYTCFKTDQ